ncbi:hypothetical protein PAHAL_9G195400 [Panicum hallii]|jgi:hypothetical protein|uniref:Uncharacterized protein n=1 Tax=Panicum hallii TaxID=206008 RepID=A0A2T8I1U9_9POAL|nr:hypothetical protein PAHAL_9G195400 [Panicum hallii]
MLSIVLFSLNLDACLMHHEVANCAQNNTPGSRMQHNLQICFRMLLIVLNKLKLSDIDEISKKKPANKLFTSGK